MPISPTICFVPIEPHPIWSDEMMTLSYQVRSFPCSRCESPSGMPCIGKGPWIGEMRRHHLERAQAAQVI